MLIVDVVCIVVAGATLVGWFVFVYVTGVRPTTAVRPEAPTFDLRDEPPAVVNLLVNRAVDAPQASSSTVIDLVDRRILDIIETAEGPAGTMVVPRGGDPGVLTPYEQRVLDRIRQVGGTGPVRLTTLLSSFADGGSDWNRRLVNEVRSDARRRGLTRRAQSDFLKSSRLAALIIVVALALPIGVPIATGAVRDDGSAAAGLLSAAFGVAVVAVVLIVPWLIVWVLLALSAAFWCAFWGEPDRYTAAGRAATAHWLGVAGQLREYAAFRELPAGAVAVWDRYLVYGTALDVTRHAARVLDLSSVGRLRTVWSSLTGQWRRVQVRFPRTRRHLLPTLVYTDSRGRIVWAAVMLVLWTAVGAGLLIAAPAARGSRGWLIAVVIAVALLVRYGYRLVRATVDVLWPVPVSGQVLLISTAAQDAEPDDGSTAHHPPGRVMTCHLAVDTGRTDVIRPWTVLAINTRGVRVGDLVTLSGQRWSRCARHLRPVDAPRTAPMKEPSGGPATR